MARFLPAALTEALNRPDAQIATHSTLEMFVVIGAETRTYRFATAGLAFNGINWLPQLRETSEINSDLSSEGDEITLDIQNVDTLLGVEFLNLQRYLSGAEVVMGRYWKDLDKGADWNDVLFTGLVAGLEPDEQVVKLTAVSDVYSGVSVGPLRKVRRLCPFLYKGFECGRPPTDPPTCDYTLNGAGGCDGRWGSTNKFVRQGGAPYLDNNLDFKII